jgi:hypothetical protein
MPGAQRLLAAADGGCLKGGAPRAVWLVLDADPLTVSARDAAKRLIELGRPCHLVWNPLSGEVVQLIPVVRAGRALGWADGPRWGARSPGPEWGPEPGAGQPGWGSGCGWAAAPAAPAGSAAAPAEAEGQDWAPGPEAEGQDWAPGAEAEAQDWAGNSDWMQPGDWAQQHDWAQHHEQVRADWTQDPDWTPGTGSTHGADWTQGIGWTHGSGGRPAAAGRPPEEPIAPLARDGLAGVNNEGRVCVQIGVIGHRWMPFTTGPVQHAHEIVSWLDSWHVARGWPAGHPAPFPGSGRPGQQRRRHWARGGHFGASQVPGCSTAGPGAIDIERLTGPLSGQRGVSGSRGSGNPARISAMTWQPRLTAARSAAP